METLRQQGIKDLYWGSFGAWAIRCVLVILLLFRLGENQTAEARTLGGIPVLLYHHVCDDAADSSGLTLSTAEFSRQMNKLYDNGFRTISLREFLAYMRDEPVRLPDKPLAITFDDGYGDNYRNALPVLRQVGFSASIFMVGINFDRKNRLSTTNIQAMLADGWEIGGHSMTHADLTAITGKKLTFEVADSRKKIAQMANASVDFFAYPGGKYSLATLEAVQNAGYEGAFTILAGLNSRDRDNRYLLRRIPIFGFTDFDRLLRRLDQVPPKISLLDFDD